MNRTFNALDYLLQSDFGRAYPERARELAAQALASQAKAAAASRSAESQPKAAHVETVERPAD